MTKATTPSDSSDWPMALSDLACGMMSLRARATNWLYCIARRLFTQLREAERIVRCARKKKTSARPPSFRLPSPMHPHPLLRRLADDAFQARGQVRGQRQHIALRVAAARVVNARHGDAMAFGAPLVPAENHGRADAERKRRGDGRRECRPSKKPHVVARSPGILVDQKRHQSVGAKHAQNRFTGVLAAPNDFETALAAPLVQPGGDAGIVKWPRDRRHRITRGGDRLTEDLPVADVTRDQDAALPFGNDLIEHATRIVVKLGEIAPQARQLPDRLSEVNEHPPNGFRRIEVRHRGAELPHLDATKTIRRMFVHFAQSI